jgi:hypothetical protein
MPLARHHQMMKMGSAPRAIFKIDFPERQRPLILIIEEAAVYTRVRFVINYCIRRSWQANASSSVVRFRLLRHLLAIGSESGDIGWLERAAAAVCDEPEPFRRLLPSAIRRHDRMIRAILQA